MDTNDFINPRKDLINGTINKVTPKPHVFNIDKAAELVNTNSAELSDFNYLLAQYKAKVLEQYAFLYKY